MSAKSFGKVLDATSSSRPLPTKIPRHLYASAPLHSSSSSPPLLVYSYQYTTFHIFSVLTFCSIRSQLPELLKDHVPLPMQFLSFGLVLLLCLLGHTQVFASNINSATSTVSFVDVNHHLRAVNLQPDLLPVPLQRFALSNFVPFCEHFTPPEVQHDVVPECVAWEVRSLSPLYVPHLFLNSMKINMCLVFFVCVVRCAMYIGTRIGYVVHVSRFACMWHGQDTCT